MISSFQLKSVAATLDYHADAFSQDRTQEGAAGEQTPATWGGKGAALAGLGIGAQIKAGDFQAVLEGRIDGQQVPGGYSREYGAGHHKPGMDYTFSPGKSVSVTALVGGDERLLGAHNAAVESSMQWLEERGAVARVGGQDQQTGNLLYAKMDHITSRQQDPQVHTHVVIANATRTDDGKWRALDNHQLLSLRKEADGIYGQALDRNLHSLGYKTEQGKSGPEISGYTREQLGAFSLRTADIERHLEGRGLTLETANAAQRQVANLSTRPDKEALPRDQLQGIWRERAREVGLDAGELSAARPEPQRVQPRGVEQGAVDKAVGQVVDAIRQAGMRFDALALMARHAPDRDQRADAVASMRRSYADQQPKSAAQIGKQVREQPGLRYASNAQVEKALSRAVDSGKLLQSSGKYAVDHAASLQRRDTLREMSSPARRLSPRDVDQAVGRVVERMQQARQDVQLLQRELTHARSRGQAGQVEKLEGQRKESSKALALTMAQARAAVRAELGERPAANQGREQQPANSWEAGLERYAKSLAPAPAADAPRTRSAVSNGVIDAALERALAGGQLHRNVDKLSVETESQTDARLAGQRAERTAYQKEVSAAQRAVATKARAKEWQAKQAKQREHVLAARAKRVRQMTPAQRKAATRNRTVHNVVRTVKTLAYVARNPIRGTTRIAQRAAARLAWSAAKTTLQVAGTLALGAVKAVGYQAAASLGTQRMRDVAKSSVQARARELTAKHQVTRLATMGYRVNGAGEVERAKLTATNAVMLLGSAALDATRLSRTTGGLALRNTLVATIKTTRVNAVEALAAKGMMATSCAVGRVAQSGMRRAHQAVYARHHTRLQATYEFRRKAYLSHVSATLAHQAGRLDDAGLSASRQRLEGASQAATAAQDRLLKAAGRELDAGRISGAQYERVYAQTKVLRSAVEGFKAHGEVGVQHQQAFLGLDRRGVQQLEAKAGKDHLGLGKAGQGVERGQASAERGEKLGAERAAGGRGAGAGREGRRERDNSLSW